MDVASKGWWAEEQNAAFICLLEQLLTHNPSSPCVRNAGAQDLLDEQQALRQQLEQATQQLKAKQAEEAAAVAALGLVQARLESAAAEKAGMQQRLDALQKRKVGDSSLAVLRAMLPAGGRPRLGAA